MNARFRLFPAKDALSPDDLDADVRAVACYRSAMNRAEVRRALAKTPLRFQVERLRKTSCPSRALTVVFEQLTYLRNAGCTEAELNGFAVAVQAYVADLFTGKDATPLAQLDRLEERAEAHENQLFVERVTEGESGIGLRTEAQANYHEAAISIARGRALERRARDRERMHETSVNRLAQSTEGR